MRFSWMWSLAILSACCGSPPPANPLLNAAALGETERLERLLDAGGDLSQSDDRGLTALHWAARGGHVRALTLLLNNGADIDAVDGASNGWTPLMHAIHVGAGNAARELMAAGADLEKRSRSGSTALMMAAGYGDSEMVRELLATGADPYAESGEGMNALWAAAGGGALVDFTDGPPLGTCFPETIDLLLSEAPDLRLPANASTRAIEWLAGLRGCSETVASLQEP